MIFDIRTPDSAYEFIKDFFKITGSEFIDEYVIRCNNNFEEFWDKHLNYIDSVNIDSLKYTVFHVTTNWNECYDIKNGGIKNLQKVLSEQNELNTLLLSYGVRFDIDNKVLITDNRVIDIDYEKYRKNYMLSDYEKKIAAVAHKIYYDFQVNGFFSNNNVINYGTKIHIRPEFLLNLTSLVPRLAEAEEYWGKSSNGYIVTFLAEFEQFAWDSFYAHEYEYWDDIENKLQLKKWIISKAINRCSDNLDSYSEEIAYMDANTIIKPDQIIDYQEIVIDEH